MEYLYRCLSEGPANNYFLSSCEFEMKFKKGPHNCPICGSELTMIKADTGPSISEILRRGQREVDQQNKGTNK